MHHARSDHLQARLLESTQHLADQVTADAVRLDNGKSALNGHDDLGYGFGSGPQGADKDREVYWSRRVQAIAMTAEVPVLLGKSAIRRAAAKPRSSDVETLAAAAFTLGFGILELEGLVQPLFDEIHQGSVDQRQACRIHHDFDAASLENRIARMNFVSIIHDIRKSRTSGLLDADPQADPGAPLSPDVNELDQPLILSTISPYRAALASHSNYPPTIHNTHAPAAHGPSAHFFAWVFALRCKSRPKEPFATDVGMG